MKLLIIVLCLITVGCAALPTAPSYLCYTKPRSYINPVTGVSTLEVDTYTQTTSCPEVRID